MAHTPFFARLLRAGGLAAEATRRNIPVDQVLDEHSEGRGLNRRQFIALSMAAGGLAACSDADRATGLLVPQSPRRSVAPGTRVAVVGAGLAGLTCAYRLRQ